MVQIFEEKRKEIEKGRLVNIEGVDDPVDLALLSDVPHHLAGKTMEILAMEINDCLLRSGYRHLDKAKKVKSMEGYSAIYLAADLVLGRFVRWIRYTTNGKMDGKPNPYLTNGAFLCNILEEDGNETIMVLKTWNGQYIKVKFASGRVFQQLNSNELMVMILSSRLC